MPEKKETAAARTSVPFRTITHLYDADDPSPEAHRELPDRAEYRKIADIKITIWEKNSSVVGV